MGLRVAVLDDEPLAVEVLADYVQRTAELTLVAATGDVFKVLKMVQENKIDLVLLDIQMPELTGIQFMKIIGTSCRVIITTAYTDYALDSYDFSVTDYLLKPIAYERFVKAINKLLQPPSSQNQSPVKKSNYIFIKSEYRLVRVAMDDILYIEALRDYVAIYTILNGKIMSLDSLKNMEELLPPGNFIRIQKSFIVAIDKIEFVERNRVIIKDKFIPIGESYQEKFLKLIKAG